MRTFLSGVCLAVALSVAAPVGATPFAAQTTTAAAVIAGVVTDATGAALPGATVVLRDVATGREKTAVSGPDGKYSLEAAGTGTYLVLVTRLGFSEAARTVVVTQAERRIELPVQLELGG